MADTIVAEFLSMSTATVSDAMDRLGVPGQCLGLKPLDPRTMRLCGRAFTVRMIPAETPAGSVGDYIDDVEAGQVVVLDNQGRQNATVWGDILTAIAHRMRVAGTVIDGHCRDAQLALELNYPMFTRGWSMRTGKDRVQLQSVNVPVNIGDALVCAGDIMLGDADGVLCIPSKHEQRILENGRGIHAAENAIRAAVEGGMTLREARAKFKYHSLQTRQE
jgi:regulator of RNase E activity RraA